MGVRYLTGRRYFWTTTSQGLALSIPLTSLEQTDGQRDTLLISRLIQLGGLVEINEQSLFFFLDHPRSIVRYLDE